MFGRAEDCFPFDTLAAHAHREHSMKTQRRLLASARLRPARASAMTISTSSSHSPVQVIQLSKDEAFPRPSTPSPTAHHLPNGAGFKNPWDSYSENAPKIGFKQFVETNWIRGSKTVPIPKDPKDRPAQVIKPDLTDRKDRRHCLKSTWLGHASWLIGELDQQI